MNFKCSYCGILQWNTIYDLGASTVSLKCDHCEKINVFRMDQKIIKFVERTFYIDGYKDKLIDIMEN